MYRVIVTDATTGAIIVSRLSTTMHPKLAERIMREPLTTDGLTLTVTKEPPEQCLTQPDMTTPCTI